MATATGSSSTSSWLEQQLRSYEEIVLAVKSEVLEAYHARCLVTEGECANLHLDACRSRLPDGQCDQQELLDICVDEGCGIIRDYYNPVVRLPESVANGANLNPTDPNAIETMCYSVLLNTPLRELYARASEVGSSAVYFGAWTGVFRYFPGIAQSECGSYDPRIRPWYVAASSGPKDVVIVVDVSGSMGQQGRLELAKEAATTVIHTLGADSFVNVVTFSEAGYALLPNSTTLVRADEANVATLVELVGNLEIDLSTVATNFGSAFETTFDLIDASRATEGVSSSCQTAIVFLTDGQITVGPDANETIAMIDERNANIGANVFSYSLGSLADKVTAKQIACETGGTYQHVEDGGDLSQAMAFFYRYYAIGLGYNEDFVASTDIYTFATGGDSGFTIAAPLYENTTTPPAFLGVVAIDFKTERFVEEYDVTIEELQEALNQRNTECPELSLTECQRQVFRGSISSLSVCDDIVEDCSDVGSLEPERCMEESEYPTELWQNVDQAAYDFTERTCCGSNYSAAVVEPSCEVESAVDDTNIQDSDGSSNGEAANIGVALAAGIAAAVLLLLGVLFCIRARNKKYPTPKLGDRSHAVAEAVGPPRNAPQTLSVETHQ